MRELGKALSLTHTNECMGVNKIYVYFLNTIVLYSDYASFFVLHWIPHECLMISESMISFENHFETGALHNWFLYVKNFQVWSLFSCYRSLCSFWSTFKKKFKMAQTRPAQRETVVYNMPEREDREGRSIDLKNFNNIFCAIGSEMANRIYNLFFKSEKIYVKFDRIQ